MTVFQTINLMLGFIPAGLRSIVISFVGAFFIFGIFHLVVFIKKLFLFG